MSDAPRYCPEVRFYSRLGISYGFGSRLRRLGVLVPDALMDNDAPLFLSTPESLECHRGRIRDYRAMVAEARNNALPIPA